MAAQNTDLLKKLSPKWTGNIGAAGVAKGTVDTIPLTSASNLPTDTAVVATINRVDANGARTTGGVDETIIGVVSGNNLINCVRGVEGTAQAHSAGQVVEILVTAKGINDIVDWGLVEHGQDGKHTVLSKPTIKSSIQTIVADSDAATITFDLDAGNVHTVTLGGNRILALSNADTGQYFVLELTQDGTGSRTVTWFETIRWVDGSAPTLTTTADKRDVFGFRCTGTNTYDGYIVGQNL